eukprot:11167157-Lingulodinium_polyedra.AAC.1
MPTPGARTERANVRFGGGGRSIQWHHCATLHKRCTMARSSRRFATATARELHARAPHAHASFLVRAWSAKRDW